MLTEGFYRHMCLGFLSFVRPIFSSCDENSDNLAVEAVREALPEASQEAVMT